MFPPRFVGAVGCCGVIGCCGNTSLNFLGLKSAVLRHLWFAVLCHQATRSVRSGTGRWNDFWSLGSQFWLHFWSDEWSWHTSFHFNALVGCLKYVFPSITLIFNCEVSGLCSLSCSFLSWFEYCCLRASMLQLQWTVSVVGGRGWNMATKLSAASTVGLSRRKLVDI